MTGTIVIFGAVACASAGMPRQPVAADAPVAKSQVEAVMSALADDSMEGRMTSSRGAAKAAAFIAQQMSAVGLVAAGDSGYFQRVPIALTRRANGQERLTLVTGFAALDTFPADHRKPGVNVVGMIRGSDPAVSKEVVLVDAHYDHLGVGKAVNGDSIYNGADDDGSGSVSALEIAQYFASLKVKPKRSLLFVWHVGEEAGLYGSEWYTDHPTVPRDSIVAQLNMDMVGRGAAADNTGITKAGVRYHGNPDYVQLVGSRRLSTELGDLAESVNTSEKHPFRFDYAMDANGHPSNIYCRSDHYEYARYGIPIIFFTTGGHADYHQVTDEPQYIDYDRMARVAQYVADLATKVANLEHRPVVDKQKPDPNGECVQ